MGIDYKTNFELMLQKSISHEAKTKSELQKTIGYRIKNL